MEQKNRLVVTRVWGWGKRFTTKAHEGTWGGGVTDLFFIVVVMTQLYVFVKIPKRVGFCYM